MSDLFDVTILALDIAVNESSREGIARLVKDHDLLEPVERLYERVFAEFGDGSRARELALFQVTAWLFEKEAPAETSEHKFIADFLGRVERIDGPNRDINAVEEALEQEAARAGVPIERARTIAWRTLRLVRRQPERVAYHEAGHAVACFVLRRRFDVVSIIPNDESLGHVSCGNYLSKGSRPAL